MRVAFLLTCLLTLCMTVPSSAAPSKATNWPAGRTGMLAKRWVDAFAAGEDSMRAFLTTDMAAAGLAERNVAARIVRYRERQLDPDVLWDQTTWRETVSGTLHLVGPRR